jgi:leucyl aminopeptidase
MSGPRLEVREAVPSRGPTPLAVFFGVEGDPPRALEGIELPRKGVRDFAGKFRETHLLYPNRRSGPERVLLIGLGKREKVGAEEVRRAAAVAYARAKELRVPEYRTFVDEDLQDRLGVRATAVALAEGTVLSSYRIEMYRTNREETPAVRSVTFVPGGATAAFRRAVEFGERVAGSQNYARELANRPANEKTPSALAAEAKKIAEETGARCRVFTEDALRKMGMGAFLGVARGSSEPPRFIVLRAPGGRRGRVCIVGKGITFDSGGISLKPAKGMEEMKYDMSGGAAILGTFRALPSLGKLPFEVIGIVPATENLPGGRAQKPGDLVRAYNGKTIEVLNTDAEGRMILADALAYAAKEFAPDAIVDLATLTGAAIVALGHEVSGILGNDAGLVRDLREAGEATGERVWELPLWEEHREQMKGEVADLRNINSPNQGGGTIAGAAFLSHFVEGRPWAHVDIAGTAWGARDRDYYRRGASGVGVRLLVEFLRARAESPRR